jgi:hypothetical protein
MNTADDAIRRDLIACYQKQFGNKWSSSLHKLLVPSPFRFLSVVYNVPIDYVFQIYNQLINQFRPLNIKNGNYGSLCEQ